MNKRTVISFAKEAINAVIKNSEVVQPYVHPKDYRNGLIVLNVLHWGLRFLESKEKKDSE